MVFIAWSLVSLAVFIKIAKAFIKFRKKSLIKSEYNTLSAFRYRLISSERSLAYKKDRLERIWRDL